MEAARAAGLWPWQHGDHTLWNLPGDSNGLPLEDPRTICTVASWLRSDVVATGGAEAHGRYIQACGRIDPRSVWTGVVFVGDDLVICAAMVALKRWTIEYARVALGVAQPSEVSLQHTDAEPGEIPG